MIKHKRKPLALILAQAISAGSLIAAAPGVMAQDVQRERITVTGSSIQRIATEGALPVLELNRSYIDQSGATNATELIQSLPQVQNFVANSASVNGGGAGIATASLHALPSKYTLVLIDGMRPPVAALSNSNGGGFAVNINSIPLDAVERVEILLDGATAVYGSDAIAGVVNFILKKNTTEGNVYAQYTWPTKAGGNGVDAGISKGFGDLQKDGFNILGTLGYSHQDELTALQRSASSKGGYFPFTYKGTNYIYNNRTSNTEPANVTFQARPAGTPDVQANYTAYSLSPYYRANGNCGQPPALAGVLLDPTGTGTLGAVGESCRFNFAATVQDIPSSDRLNFLGKGYLKLGDNATGWATIGLNHFTTNAQYAPPAQPFGINATTRVPSLYNTYVVPFLTANNLVIHPGSSATSPLATVGYRGVGQGGRADDYETNGQLYAVGVDGNAWGWIYNARATWGVAHFTDTAAGGYGDTNKINAAIAAGLYDPIAGTGGASIRPFILTDRLQDTKSKQGNLHVGAQHDFFELPGGPTTLFVGLDWYTQKYDTNYSHYYLANSGFDTQPADNNVASGGGQGLIPFGASRDNWSVNGEWFFPIFKSFEATASLRYDHYDKTHSTWVFALDPDPITGLIPHIADADLGNTFSKTTGKIAARWTPISGLLFRGSYGTGFRAPAMSDIAGALAFNGSTSNSYPCPFPGSVGCLPGSAQYDLLAGPNGLSGDAGLKPETSKQWTVGARWDVAGFSLGADLWNVQIKNQVLSQGIAESVAFGNPQQYLPLFTNPYLDPSGFNTIAFAQLPFNGGTANYRGIDWDATYHTDTRWGMFSANWTGTYMLKADYTFGPGLPKLTDLGIYGPDQQVVFKTTMQLILSLQTGPWLNSLTGHYKSGYTDTGWGLGTNVFLANSDGSLGPSVAFCCLKVPSYTTFDWQTAYNFTKDIRGTFGILNIFDRDPPRSLQNGGGGNQSGYDGRYYDPIGRALYGRINVKF
jgi:iron complex outermembrane receptor protein